ncbi:MAG: hypothetical protein DRQ55_07800 [Planctomycetota bacterium]|nr:MAG: hypothetical protein DRQ55_07800 [Planctomycetota bacterium]
MAADAHTPTPATPDDPSEGGEGERDVRGGKSERKAFLLRLPPALLAELRAWANQDLRSLNGQLEFLLREALRKRKGGGPS